MRIRGRSIFYLCVGVFLSTSSVSSAAPSASELLWDSFVQDNIGPRQQANLLRKLALRTDLAVEDLAAILHLCLDFRKNTDLPEIFHRQLSLAFNNNLAELKQGLRTDPYFWDNVVDCLQRGYPYRWAIDLWKKLAKIEKPGPRLARSTAKAGFPCPRRLSREGERPTLKVFRDPLK